MFSYQTRVRVPDGRVGYVEARIFDFDGPTSRYLVTFRRSEYSPEDWKRISPFGGPSVSEEFEDKDLVIEKEPARIINSYRPSPVSISQVIEDAKKSIQRHGTSRSSLGEGEFKRLLESVTIESIWKSNRGENLYRVYNVQGGRVFLQSLDTSESREVSLNRFPKLYTRLASSINELDESYQEKFKQKKISSVSKSLQSVDLVQPGTLWASRRNNDIYKVLTVEGNKVKLSWTGGKYIREVTLETVVRYYNFVEASCD